MNNTGNGTPFGNNPFGGTNPFQQMGNGQPKEKKKLSKKGKTIIKLAVIFVLFLILCFNSFYTIREQEQAVVTTFGRAEAVTASGLHFKIPFVQEVQKVDTTIQGLAIGYDKGTGESIEEESLMITADFNFVNVDFFLEYRVADPVKMLYASEQPETILKNITQSCIRRVVGSYDVDSVLTTGKNEIQSVIREDILKNLEEQDIGISLVNITIQDAEPPTEEVMEAFKAVETAKQGKETAVNNATKYQNEMLPEAEAKVDKILQEAESEKQNRIYEAEGQVARFNSIYEEYVKNPTVTKQRMFFEAMEEILPSLKIVIESPDGKVQEILPLDTFMNIETQNNKESAE